MRVAFGAKTIVLIPSPKSAVFTGEVLADTTFEDGLAEALLSPSGFGRVIPVEHYSDGSTPKGGYELEVTAEGVSINSSDAEGRRNAAVTLAEIVRQLGGLAVGKISDYPDFAVRAVLEGYCGRPWPQDGRRRIFTFMARRKFNRFYSSTRAPKASFAWREPFTRDELDEIGEAAEDCRQYGIDYVFSIRPADISVSDSVERLKLFAKLEAVSKLGVTHFMLLEDDIKIPLSAGDLAHFGDYGTAHAALATETLKFLKSRNSAARLVFCPTPYTTESLGAEGMTDYIEKVRVALPPDVEVIWTGPWCCSAKVDEYDADHYAAFVGRKPFLWDNYPVIDGKPGMLFLGPLRRRGQRLFEHISGYGANAMDWPIANFIPLSTIAEYLWNPLAYEPDAAIKDAVIDELGEAAMPAAMRLVELFSSDWQEPEIEPGPGGSGETWQRDRGNAEAAERLRQTAAELPGLVDKLAGLTDNKEFIEMLQPVVGNLVEMSKVFSLDLEAITRVNSGDEKGAALIEHRLKAELARMEQDLRPEYLAAVSYLHGNWRYYRTLTGDTSTTI